MSVMAFLVHASPPPVLPDVSYLPPPQWIPSLPTKYPLRTSWRVMHLKSVNVNVFSVPTFRATLPVQSIPPAQTYPQAPPLVSTYPSGTYLPRTNLEDSYQQKYDDNGQAPNISYTPYQMTFLQLEGSDSDIMCFATSNPRV